jgi:hypothetical protein
VTLNVYRDEAGRFLEALGEPPDTVWQRVLPMLEEELATLKAAEDPPARQHQVYDLLFLLMELAAADGMDLDAEWTAGRQKKARTHGGS